MEREQFDDLARRVSTRQSRRTALAMVLGALLLRQEPELVSAKRKRHGRRHSHRPGKQKANRKGQRNGQGKVGTQDCPDGTIECWVENYPGGPCDTQAGTLPGQVGTCYRFPFCYPCNPPDQNHWSNLCNQTFSACEGRCGAILRMPFIPAGGYCCPPGSCL